MLEPRPVRVAVILEHGPTAGGGYQQPLNMALRLGSFDPAICTPVFLSTSPESQAALQRLGIDCSALRLSSFDNFRLRLRRAVTSRMALRVLNTVFGPNPLDALMASLKIDLVYFTGPSPLATFLERHNFVWTAWDLCHRDAVEFPEVNDGREFERRDTYYGHATTKAVAVLVDSALGRDNLIRCYGAEPDRVVVEPFSAASAILHYKDKAAEPAVDIREKYGIKTDYVLYPAQFWAHKNHVYLLRGLAELERRHGVTLSAIMPGSDKGARAHVEQCARELGLGDRVVFPGYVSDEDLAELYRSAVALVMPTYFGPTNLPPLEAFEFGVPVLYSDLPGQREQVGDAALLLDLTRPSDLAEKLDLLVRDPALRQSLVARGTARLAQLQPSGASPLLDVLRRFQARRAAWA